MLKDMGEKIKMLRLDLDLTQAALAQKLGVTKSIVSAYENSTRYPSYEQLIKLSNFFGVSTDYLLGCPKNNVIDVSGLKDREIEGLIKMIYSLKKKS